MDIKKDWSDLKTFIPEEQTDKAIDNLIDSWDLKELITYARKQMQAWVKTADQKEIERLIEEHG